MSTILLVITNCFCEAHASLSVKVSFWSDIQILAWVLLMHFGSPFLLVGPHFIRNLTNLGSHCMWEKWEGELSAGEPPIDSYCSALQKERLILVAAHQSWIRPNTLQTLHCCTADFAGDPGWKERGTINNGGRRSINPGGRSALHSASILSGLPLQQHFVRK